MPTYKITDPQTGKTLRVTGDSPPTEKELGEIFSSQGGNQQPGLLRKAGSAAEAVGNFFLPSTTQAVKGVINDPASLVKESDQPMSMGQKALGYGLSVLPGGNSAYLSNTPAAAAAREIGGNIVANEATGAVGKMIGNTPIGKGLSKAVGAVGDLVSETIPQRLMGNVFKEPLKDTRSAIQSSLRGSGSAKNLGIEALERGEMGSAEQIFTNSAKNIEGLEETLQKALQSEQKTVNLDKVKESLLDYVLKLKQAGNSADADSIINRIANIEQANGGKEVPVSIANEIKRTLYDEARNAYGKTASENLEGIKAIAKGFRQGIEEAVPDVKTINKELSYHGRIIDSMTDRMARVGRNELLSLKNAGLVGSGIATAPMTGGASLVPAVAAAFGGTTQGQTMMAQGLHKIPQVVSPIVQAAMKVAKPLINNQTINAVNAPTGGGGLGLDIGKNHQKYLYR
jgi:hypothetical protein